MIKFVCRDCLHTGGEQLDRCPSCNGQRIISHDQLGAFSIAHLDCDAFYAAIEKRDNPDLAAKPVIVGGGKRGVVATCCYIARIYGVRSAMPMFKALKLCPDAVVIKPRMDIYGTEGRKIRAMMQALTPLVEPVSIDEAYLDLTGADRLHGAPAAVTLAKLQTQIETELNLTVSIGLSTNKFLAKTASELDKPRGYSVLGPIEAVAFLAGHTPRFIHGVGPQLAAKLERDGYSTIENLQTADLKSLIKKYGEQGMWLYKRAHGEDTRPVTPDHARKSVSAETTFNTNISDLAQLEDILWRQCMRVADRAKSVGTEGRTVSLKLKTADFKAVSRQTALQTPTQLAQTIFRSSRELLRKAADGRRFRLLGVGISDLSDAPLPENASDISDLADPKSAKRAAAERAMDIARSKFGGHSVSTGRGLKSQKD